MEVHHRSSRNFAGFFPERSVLGDNEISEIFLNSLKFSEINRFDKTFNEQVK